MRRKVSALDADVVEWDNVMAQVDNDGGAGAGAGSAGATAGFKQPHKPGKHKRSKERTPVSKGVEMQAPRSQRVSAAATGAAPKRGSELRGSQHSVV